MDATARQESNAGIQLYMQQDYSGAEKALTESLRTQPVWAEGWSYLGFAQYMQQKHTEAAASLEKAVMLNQDNAEARFGLGLVWAALKKVDSAIACWDETLRLKPGHADAKKSLTGGLLFRAQGFMADKDYDRAEADMERAIKIDRLAPQAYVALANHFMALDMTVRAQKTVSEALGYIPNDAHIQGLAMQLKVDADRSAQVAAQDAQARQQVQKAQEVPCPNCKRPVMEWAAICPHCNMQIKAIPSLFASRQAATRAVEWQDVMYYIVSALWIVFGSLPLIIALAAGKLSAAFSGFAGFVNAINLAMVIVGVGLLFKMDSAMYVAKILCYIVLVIFTPYFLLSFFGGLYLVSSIIFGMMTMVGFMIYLLNYMGAGE